MEEVPNPKLDSKKPRDQTYKKSTENNENYSINLKMKGNYSIYIAIAFEGDNKTFEAIKLYGDIKKQQAYFEDYTLEEIYDELAELISKNNFQLNKEQEQILFNIALPLKKRKTLDFILEYKKSQKMLDNALFKQIIKQKDDIIKQKDEVIKRQDDIIKQKDEIIKEKNNIIKSLEEIIKKNNYVDENKKEKEDKIETKQGEKQISKKTQNYNEIFKDFNIINHTPQNKLTAHGDKPIYTLLQLQDGRLASGRK